MRKFFGTLFAILLGLIFVIFAVANRHFVTVSFDPFHSVNPTVAVSMPLFGLIIAVAILGVIAGGCATWFGQRRHNLIEDRVHDILDIPLIEVRVVLGNTLNKFGFDHREVGSVSVG